MIQPNMIIDTKKSRFISKGQKLNFHCAWTKTNITENLIGWNRKTISKPQKPSKPEYVIRWNAMVLR